MVKKPTYARACVSCIRINKFNRIFTGRQCLFLYIPGKFHGQIYSYPERRWKKKKHYFLFNEEKQRKATDIETGEAGKGDQMVRKHACSINKYLFWAVKLKISSLLNFFFFFFFFFF